jgi:hypothetical protein
MLYLKCYYNMLTSTNYVLQDSLKALFLQRLRVSPLSVKWTLPDG